LICGEEDAEGKDKANAGRGCAIQLGDKSIPVSQYMGGGGDATRSSENAAKSKVNGQFEDAQEECVKTVIMKKNPLQQQQGDTLAPLIDNLPTITAVAVATTNGTPEVEVEEEEEDGTKTVTTEEVVAAAGP